jgi:hypothetical protein
LAICLGSDLLPDFPKTVLGQRTDGVTIVHSVTPRLVLVEKSNTCQITLGIFLNMADGYHGTLGNEQ